MEETKQKDENITSEEVDTNTEEVEDAVVENENTGWRV